MAYLRMDHSLFGTYCVLLLAKTELHNQRLSSVVTAPLLMSLRSLRQLSNHISWLSLSLANTSLLRLMSRKAMASKEQFRRGVFV